MRKLLVIGMFLLAFGAYGQKNVQSVLDTVKTEKERTIQDVSDIELVAIGNQLKEDYNKIVQQLDIIDKELKRRVELFKSKTK